MLSARTRTQDLFVLCVCFHRPVGDAHFDFTIGHFNHLQLTNYKIEPSSKITWQIEGMPRNLNCI